MSIAALVLWMVTAGAGLYLLMPVIAVKRLEASQLPVHQSASALAGAAVAGGVGAAPAPGRAEPHITHTRITTGPGEHPLVEFSHPALGFVGLGCWMAFIASHYGTFAWIAFGVLLTTIGAGVRWLISNTRAARRRRGGEERVPRVPRHLILVHGTAATITLALAATTVLSAIHS